MKAAALVFAAAALVAAGSAPDVTVLASRATALLHSKPQFKKAALLEADGSPAAGKHWVTRADQIVKWRFVFQNKTAGSKYESATVLAVRGHLGKVQGHTQPFLEDQVIRPIPTMTLAHAVGLVEYAGYRRFSSVTMRKPLYPGVKHTYYIFAVDGGKRVEVDTATGQVKQVS
jgi:hypothetical protein